MSWRNVFCSAHVRWEGILSVQRVARASGYEFYTWNDKVYRTDDNKYKPHAIINGDDFEIGVP
jgi:hypothetical protein